MKKNCLFNYLIFAFCAIAISACGDNGNKITDTSQSQDEIISALVGSWSADGDSCDSDDVFTFDKDGKYLSEDEKGTWSVVNDYLKVDAVVAPDEDTRSKTAADEWGVKVRKVDETQAILHRGDGTEIVWKRCPAK